MEEIIQNLILELRRGTLILSVLSQLRERQYGYALKERLVEQGVEIDQGTLYPLLRRLEKQGLLDSEWDVSEARPRRYYVLSEQGREVLTIMVAEWQQLVSVMEQVLAADK
ncbi:MAG: PadR family transcriptional regulator [Chloroflexi bacterium]|nr:PadR family transcriptional regulator [Chloroflexota bacterium]OQB03149.1 MAG: lineage-specific thermal regulator protein [Chloroflexi bacterium ADurb.Bin222]HOC20214.1 helix-turn-helix transcriptional regulator [Anaerolineae bacterium]HQJ12591.1 helix-turn-helix transcriptional regulator [Anaerolineae bacterium]HQM13569.1 helix-turn-helix transcriptional regulator [Anaerolineae bacterium]